METNLVENEIDNDSKFKLEQYSKGVEFLRDSDIITRIAGIYLLEKVMKKSEDYHWTAIEILTAFIREKRNKEIFIIEEGVKFNKNTMLYINHSIFDKEKEEHISKLNSFKSIPIEKDIQAIITILGRRDKKFEKPHDYYKKYLDLSNTYLYKADFSQFQNEGNDANFQWFNFNNSILVETNCKNTDFKETSFNCVSFGNSNCEDAHFENSLCDYAHFDNANCWYAHFDNAICFGTHFDNANCSYANFDNANCSYANFELANLKGCSLKCTDFKKSDFKNAQYLTNEQLIEAKILYNVKNLNPKREEDLKKIKPELFVEPEK